MPSVSFLQRPDELFWYCGTPSSACRSLEVDFQVGLCCGSSFIVHTRAVFIAASVASAVDLIIFPGMMRRFEINEHNPSKKTWTIYNSSNAVLA